MEQNELALTLRQESKSAMIHGILSQAIPAVIAAVAGILYAVSVFSLVIRAGFQINDPKPILNSAMLLMLALIVAGIPGIVFGFVGWMRSSRVAKKARANGLRRPPMSIVGLILGISGFAAGIVISLMGTIEAILFSMLRSML